MLQGCWVLWEQVGQASYPGSWVKESFLEQVLIVWRLEGWVRMSPVKGDEWGGIEKGIFQAEGGECTKSWHWRGQLRPNQERPESKEPMRGFMEWSDMWVCSFQSWVKTGPGSQVRRLFELSSTRGEWPEWRQWTQRWRDFDGSKQMKAEWTIISVGCKERGCGEWLSSFWLRQLGTVNAIHWDWSHGRRRVLGRTGLRRRF